MADGRTRWSGPAQREEMSFQAVTGASTNTPSVGGEAWLRLHVRGWRVQGQCRLRLADPGHQKYPQNVAPNTGKGSRNSGILM